MLFSRQPLAGEEYSGASSSAGTQRTCCCSPRCGSCLATPNQWRLTIAGVLNADCSDCGLLNGTFILTRTEYDPCCWEDTEACPCPGGGVSFRWKLCYIPGGAPEWALESCAGAGVYRRADSLWDCNNINTMNRVLEFTTPCQYSATTVTMEPV